MTAQQEQKNKNTNLEQEPKLSHPLAPANGEATIAEMHTARGRCESQMGTD